MLRRWPRQHKATCVLHWQLFQHAVQSKVTKTVSEKQLLRNNWSKWLPDSLWKPSSTSFLLISPGICNLKEGPFCFTSTEARLLIKDGDRGEEGERVKARPRIPPEKDRRDRGPPPEQWKCPLYETIPMRWNFRVLCPCVRRKFVDWDVPAAMLGLLGVAWAKAVSINRNTKK